MSRFVDPDLDPAIEKNPFPDLDPIYSVKCDQTFNVKSIRRYFDYRYSGRIRFLFNTDPDPTFLKYGSCSDLFQMRFRIRPYSNTEPDPTFFKYESESDQNIGLKIFKLILLRELHKENI